MEFKITFVSFIDQGKGELSEIVNSYKMGMPTLMHVQTSFGVVEFYPKSLGARGTKDKRWPCNSLLTASFIPSCFVPSQE